MTILKKISLGALALAFVVPTMQSCTKLATNRKLDGSWTLSSATMDGSSSNTTTFAGTTTTSNGTSTTSFDGTTATQTTSWTSGGVTTTNTTSWPMSMTIAFDKKEGTYTSTTTTTTTDTARTDYYMNDASAGYVYEGTADAVWTTTATTTETGVFQFSGGNADIDKNSLIVFTPTHVANTDASTIEYYIGSTALTASSWYTEDDDGDWVTLPIADSSTEDQTLTSSEGEIWTVTENKGGTMKVSVTENSSWTDGTGSSTDEWTNSYELTQE